MQTIKNLTHHQDNNKLRITFDWPAETTQVHIAKENDFTKAKLFTLQEYKSSGGFVTSKSPGITNYYIFPSKQESGQNIPTGEAAHISYTHQTIIHFQLEEKTDQYKHHKLTLQSEAHIPAATLYYVKNDHPPQSITDGIKYPIEAIRQAPLTRIIRTNKDEYIKLFLKDGENLYKLEGK